MKCPSCGKTLPSNIHHCPYCGAAVRRRVPAWARTMAILGFVGVVAILVYHFMMRSSAELTTGDEIAGTTNGSEVTGVTNFFVDVDDNDDLYVRFSLIDAEGKTTKADGSGQVRMYKQGENELLYEKNFNFSSSAFKDTFFVLPFDMFIAIKRGQREYWRYLFSIPSDEIGEEVTHKAIKYTGDTAVLMEILVNIKNGKTLTEETSVRRCFCSVRSPRGNSYSQILWRQGYFGSD